MNFIGKLLPIDGYHVSMKGNMPIDYAKSLTHLYQPLIGMQAISLYQTLFHEVELQQDGSVQTHHTLMNYLDMRLDDLYKVRLKLEGIGLLKTFREKTENHTSYTYELRAPFAPAEFFTDEMLAQLLYHHIGEAKFSILRSHYANQEERRGAEITAGFSDVFQTFQPSLSDSDITPQATNTPTDIAEIDFSWIEQMLKQRMVPVKKILTTANRRLISQMMSLYDLETFEVEKSLLWALTDENTLNTAEFKEACHDVFRSKHKQGNIRLTEKAAEPINDSTDSKPATKEEQFLAELERISPKQLLEDLSSGGQASDQDLKVIREVMTTQGLPSPVMNVLIHYVLLQSNMKLSKAYLEKIASHWSRANLKTAKEAMQFAKKEKERYQKGKSTRQVNRKPQSDEVVPDWFKERKDKNHKTSSKNSTNETNNEEFAALLREFSGGGKNNHLQG
ncbi:replication initiation and membrane attachment family protein [Virgibacillus kekensis]|uniref:Replication initiation and membrane attachment family protein n=1 Tax=Virgibacillus kekensis TaxID=202261 RepID=A0ABV9DFP7_9BACI